MMTYMTYFLMTLWLLSAALIVFAHKTYRVVIFFGVFSLITSLIYIFLGAPDVAMAEAGISAFTTIFFIVCVEKYYNRSDSIKDEMASENRPRNMKKIVPALILVIVLTVLFVYFAPIGDTEGLRSMYFERFMTDVGGFNAVTAIYLGYRVYDTLFEALLLVIAVVAVMHLSWYEKTIVFDGKHSEI